MEEIKRKKDRECARCEYVFDCKGKPQEVKQCIRFKESTKILKWILMHAING